MNGKELAYENLQFVLRLLKKIYFLITYIFFPPFCAQCKIFLKNRDVFCKDCWSEVQPIATLTFPVTKKWQVPIFAVSDYQKPLKRLILSKGWSDRAACYQLGQVVWQKTDLKNIDFDYLIPIPLHWRRYAKRGYNQAEEIASYLSRKSGKNIALVLKRVKATKFQSSCTREKREQNVCDSFKLCVSDKEKYKNKHFIIVDDLMTTGFTLKAAVKELSKLNPASIRAVVVCRVV